MLDTAGGACGISGQEPKKNSLKNKKDLEMIRHTPPLRKAKKQGDMPSTSLGPIHLKMQVLGMGGSGLEGLSSINHVTYQFNRFYSTFRDYCQTFSEVSDVWSGMCYAQLIRTLYHSQFVPK